MHLDHYFCSCRTRRPVRESPRPRAVPSVARRPPLPRLLHLLMRCRCPSLCGSRFANMLVLTLVRMVCISRICMHLQRILCTSHIGLKDDSLPYSVSVVLTPFPLALTSLRVRMWHALTYDRYLCCVTLRLFACHVGVVQAQAWRGQTSDEWQGRQEEPGWPTNPCGLETVCILAEDTACAMPMTD